MTPIIVGYSQLLDFYIFLFDAIVQQKYTKQAYFQNFTLKLNRRKKVKNKTVPELRLSNTDSGQGLRISCKTLVPADEFPYSLSQNFLTIPASRTALCTRAINTCYGLEQCDKSQQTQQLMIIMRDCRMIFPLLAVYNWFYYLLFLALYKMNLFKKMTISS